MMNTNKLFVSAVLTCASMASISGAAVNTFNVEVDGIISPKHPSTTVEVWAAFDPDQYAYYLSVFDILASPDPGGFVSQEALITQGPPVLGDIAPDGDSITGIKILHFHIPEANVFADTSNPIALWRAIWITDDFTPRDIDLSAIAHEFRLYTNNAGESEDFIDSFLPGQGVIHVVPAPASVGLLASCGLCTGAWRRRR